MQQLSATAQAMRRKFSDSTKFGGVKIACATMPLVTADQPVSHKSDQNVANQSLMAADKQDRLSASCINFR